MRRRTVLTSVGGIAAVAGLGVGLLSGKASARVGSLTIDDPAVAVTDDGTITGITINVNGDWQFDGLDTPAESVVIRLSLRPAGGTYERLGTQTKDVAAHRADSGTFGLTGVDVLSHSDLDASTFADATEDDGPATVDLDARVELLIYDADGGTGNVLAPSPVAAATAVTVSVENESATAGVGGTGAVTVTGDNQEPS